MMTIFRSGQLLPRVLSPRLLNRGGLLLFQTELPRRIGRRIRTFDTQGGKQHPVKRHIIMNSITIPWRHAETLTRSLAFCFSALPADIVVPEELYYIPIVLGTKQYFYSKYIVVLLRSLSADRQGTEIPTVHFLFKLFKSSPSI